MLEERGMPLKAEHALYASQIRHGEISQTNKFMDFWMACEEGYEDVVRVFLESGVSVDEPSSSRKTSKSLTLTLTFTLTLTSELSGGRGGGGGGGGERGGERGG